jgi:hypothetical protein
VKFNAQEENVLQITSCAQLLNLVHKMLLDVLIYHVLNTREIVLLEPVKKENSIVGMENALTVLLYVQQELHAQKHYLLNVQMDNVLKM